MANIPAAAAERLLRNAGAERVSIKAAKLFAEILEDMATEIAQGSVTLADHAGRNTVKASDVKLAKNM
ncbi:MAG: NFYB/HAP3 family transcription factor subunit [Candidatus Aenigmarchaeota archaeon]|nr:NFYB/HAP3 family transcription factor subunit [Candidatus Aenigmarchaeota archaeon]